LIFLDPILDLTILGTASDLEGPSLTVGDRNGEKTIVSGDLRMKPEDRSVFPEPTGDIPLAA
jgi:hypothetical protein